VSDETLTARFKEQAAVRAVAEEVHDGMIVGLGSGSTAARVLEELGRRVREEGWKIQGVPTSEQTALMARRLGIPLAALDATPDVALDGADQVDPALNLIKGGGGAHVREKLVALAARRVAIVADHTKAVPRLRGPVPLEVLPFALSWVLRVLPDRVPEGTPRVRVRHGRPLLSDNGNILVDLICGSLSDPAAIASKLDITSGIVDHGLFLGIADVVYLAGPEGVRRQAAESRRAPRR
jgi:ribose 5-phosphate isomerase A